MIINKLNSYYRPGFSWHFKVPTPPEFCYTFNMFRFCFQFAIQGKCCIIRGGRTQEAFYISHSSPEFGKEFNFEGKDYQALESSCAPIPLPPGVVVTKWKQL